MGAPRRGWDKCEGIEREPEPRGMRASQLRRIEARLVLCVMLGM